MIVNHQVARSSRAGPAISTPHRSVTLVIKFGRPYSPKFGRHVFYRGPWPGSAQEQHFGKGRTGVYFTIPLGFGYAITIYPEWTRTYKPPYVAPIARTISTYRLRAWERETGVDLSPAAVSDRLRGSMLPVPMSIPSYDGRIGSVYVHDPENTLHREVSFEAPIMEDDNMRKWFSLS